jgi:hypothetical protein
MVPANRQYLSTVKTTIRFRMNKKLEFLYTEEQKLTDQLYKIHLECASVWCSSWQLIVFY